MQQLVSRPEEPLLLRLGGVCLPRPNDTLFGGVNIVHEK